MFGDAPRKAGYPRDPEQDALNGMKGAYQEIVKGSGVFIQPKPKTTEPGVQHRLRKEKNIWVIEECNPNTKDWIMRAVESGRTWRDFRNPHKFLVVRIIPFADILWNMGDYIFYGSVEKQVDFLFEVCNQKKLNTKIGRRNFKSYIQNLKTRLGKHESLKFALQVLNAAEAIAKEDGIGG